MRQDSKGAKRITVDSQGQTTGAEGLSSYFRNVGRTFGRGSGLEGVRIPLPLLSNEIFSFSCNAFFTLCDNFTPSNSCNLDINNGIFILSKPRKTSGEGGRNLVQTKVARSTKSPTKDVFT